MTDRQAWRLAKTFLNWAAAEVVVQHDADLEHFQYVIKLAESRLAAKDAENVINAALLLILSAR